MKEKLNGWDALKAFGPRTSLAALIALTGAYQPQTREPSRGIPTTTHRLVVINKSGDDVFIKLEGSSLTEAYYYLSIPEGNCKRPSVKVFPVMVDYYTHTTWQCGRLSSSGGFLFAGNTRLTFTPCPGVSCEESTNTDYLPRYQPWH